jgi:hypothetical protein
VRSLLDVADNLSRASAVVKENFSKIDSSDDSSAAVLLLKTLLDGVAMTEKQLSDVNLFFNNHSVLKEWGTGFQHHWFNFLISSWLLLFRGGFKSPPPPKIP